MTKIKDNKNALLISLLTLPLDDSGPENILIKWIIMTKQVTSVTKNVNGGKVRKMSCVNHFSSQKSRVMRITE